MIKIFSKYVNWFTWENIQDLVANSKATATNKRKVFESLFAMELLTASDSNLWKQLGEKMKIQQKVDWKPSIKAMGTVASDLNQNEVCVMTDPSFKTNLLFYADRIDSKESILVLCQSTTKVDYFSYEGTASFLSMYDGLSGYQLFFPSKVNSSLVSINGFGIDPSLTFTLELFDFEKIGSSISRLMNFEASLGEATTTSKEKYVKSTKRKRVFESMYDCYTALKEYIWEE